MDIPAYEVLSSCGEGMDKCIGRAVDTRAGFLQAMSFQELENLFRRIQIGGQDSILTFFSLLR